MGIVIKEVHDCHKNIIGICYRVCCPFQQEPPQPPSTDCPKTHEVKGI